MMSINALLTALVIPKVMPCVKDDMLLEMRLAIHSDQQISGVVERKKYSYAI